MAIKTYYSSISGRGGGKLFGMSKANVYNWIKKTTPIVENTYEILEMDELYWFVFRKPRTETRENVYITTLVSRSPRHLVSLLTLRMNSGIRCCLRQSTRTNTGNCE